MTTTVPDNPQVDDLAARIETLRTIARDWHGASAEQARTLCAQLITATAPGWWDHDTRIAPAWRRAVGGDEHAIWQLAHPYGAVACALCLVSHHGQTHLIREAADRGLCAYHLGGLDMGPGGRAMDMSIGTDDGQTVITRTPAVAR